LKQKRPGTLLATFCMQRATCLNMTQEAGMQAIIGISRSTAVRLSPARPEPPAEAAAPRALVPVLPIAPSEFTSIAQRYPAATFLAHLIAVRQRSPQTRRRARRRPATARFSRSRRSAGIQ
jgi:hypothetical protein